MSDIEPSLCECGYPHSAHLTINNICPTAIYRPAKCKETQQDGFVCGLSKEHPAHLRSHIFKGVVE
jgi:hypothetical protein